MPPQGRPSSRHSATTSQQLHLRSVVTPLHTGGTVRCPKGYGLPTPSTSPTARSTPVKLPLEEKTTSNTSPESDSCFSQQQKRERAGAELPFSLSQVHPEDVRDKVFVAILKALMKLENQPSSPRELSNCILQNRYVVLGGSTPYATVSSRISQHFKRAAEARPSRQPYLAKAVDDSHARKLRYYLNPDAGLSNVPPPKLRESERPLVESTPSAPARRITPTVARKRAAKDFFSLDASAKKPAPAKKKRKGGLEVKSKSRWASSSPSVAPAVECLRRSRSETVASASPTPDAFMNALDMSYAIYSDTSHSETEDDTLRTANSSGGKNKPCSSPFYPELTEIKEEADVSRSRSETPKPWDPKPAQNSLVSPPHCYVALRNLSCEPETDVFVSQTKLEDCHYLPSTGGTLTSKIRRKSSIPGFEVSDYSSEMMKTDLLALDGNGTHLPNPHDSPRDDTREVTPLSDDCLQTPHSTQAGSVRRIVPDQEDDDVRTCPLSSGSSASSLPTPGSSSCIDSVVICQDTLPVPPQTIHFNNLQLYRNDPTLGPPISGLLSPRLAPTTTDISIRIVGPTSPLLLFSPRSTSIYGDLDEAGMLPTTDISGGLDLPLPASVCSPELAKLNVCPEVGKYHSYIPLPEPNHPETVTVGELDRLLEGRNTGGLSYLYSSGNGRLRTPRRLHTPPHASHSLINAGLGLGLGLGIGNHVSGCSVSTLAPAVTLASPLRVSHKPLHPLRNHHRSDTETDIGNDAACVEMVQAAVETMLDREEARGVTEERKEATKETKEENEESSEEMGERIEETEETKEKKEETAEVTEKLIEETGETVACPRTSPHEMQEDAGESSDLFTPLDSGEIEDGSEASKGTSSSTGGSGSDPVAKSSGSAPTTRSTTASRRTGTTRSGNAGSAGDDDDDEGKRSRPGRTLGKKRGRRRRRRQGEEESEEEEEEEEGKEDDEAVEQEKGSDVEAAKGTEEEKEQAQSEEDPVHDSGKKRRVTTQVGNHEGSEAPIEEAGGSTPKLELEPVVVAAQTEPEATVPNDEAEKKTPQIRDASVEILEPPSEMEMRQPIPEDLPFSYSPMSPTRTHRERKEARARRIAAMARRRASLMAEELAAAKVALAALESTVAIQESSESDSDYDSESNSDENGEAVRDAKEIQATEKEVSEDGGKQRVTTEGAESLFGGESSSFASAVLALVDLSAAGNRTTPDSRVPAGIVVPGSAEADVKAAAAKVSSLTAEGATTSGSKIPSGLPPLNPGPRAPVIPTRIPTNPTIYLTLIDSIPVYVTHITRTMMPVSSDEEDENHRQGQTTSVSGSAPGADRHNAQNLRASDVKNGNESPVHVTFKLLRRVDSGYVNATTLLEAGGMDTEQERSIVLSLEVGRIRVRKQGSELYGTWIPLPRGRAFAATCSLQHRLGPFLNDNLDSYFPSPLPIVPSPMETTPSVMDPVGSHHLLLASTGHKESTFRRGALRTAIGSQNPMLGEAPRLVVNAAPSTEEQKVFTEGNKPKGIKTSARRSGEGGGNSDEDTDTDTEVTEIRRRRDLGLEPLIRRPPPGNHRRRRASTSGGTAGPARKKRIFIVHGGTGETGGLVPLALAPARRKPYYTHSSVGDDSSEHEGEEGGESIQNKEALKASSSGGTRKRPASVVGRNRKAGNAAGDVKSTGSGGGTASTAGRGRQNSTLNFPTDDESGTHSSKDSSSSGSETSEAPKRQKKMSGQGRTVSGGMRGSGTKNAGIQAQSSPIPPSSVDSTKEIPKKYMRKTPGGLSGTPMGATAKKKKSFPEQKKKKLNGGTSKGTGKRNAVKGGGSHEEESELDIGGSDGDDDLR